ncbi:MAG: DUF2177 family protein [Rhodoblastus sp.]
MSRHLIAYGAAAAVFLSADALWLGVIAKDLYRAQIGHLLAPDFRVAPAAIFYLTYIAGVVFFAVSPALSSGRWQDALLPGAALGFLAYGTYDFTNWAVMRDWPAGLTFVDLAWGAFLTALAASIGAFAAIRLG